MPDTQATIAEYRLHDSDTGSPEVQIALLVGPDQPPDGAPEGAQRGPPHPAGPDEAHRPAPPAARLRPQERRRALPHHHRPSRHPTVAEHHTEPGVFEPPGCQSPVTSSARWSTTGNRTGDAPDTRGASWLTPFPCRPRSAGPTAPCPSRPGNWPNSPTAPSWPASATPSCWPRPPRPARCGRGPTSSP